MIAFLLSGCEFKSSKSYIYDVETGDKVEIKMNTSKGYNLSSSVPVEFSKKDDVIAKGIFAKEYAYDYYYQAAKNDSKSTMIEEEKNKKNITYFFYNYNDEEYNYVIKIDDSDTCFIITCDKSEKEAKELFNRLTFKLD